ncbi:MAG: 2,3-bisphosphoglycerate-dependent phosphoglycerate mutase, partial [Pyrinomonadaceae bacterium]
PNGESLKMTAARTLPFFASQILPKVHAGQNVVVCAHGNSLRAIMMLLDKLSEKEVVDLEIPNGIPIVYDFENGILTAKSFYD